LKFDSLSSLNFDLNYSSCHFVKDKFGVEVLLKDEKSLIQNLSEERILDFSTGRFCARRALLKLGIANFPIVIGDNKNPVWPDGIVGSISHCEVLTGALVAKKKHKISLGLDIEIIGRVTKDLWNLVFTKNELNYLQTLTDSDKLIMSTLIFSVKEAFYKFQHPVTGLFLEFLDVEVVIDLNSVFIKIIKKDLSIEFLQREFIPKVFSTNKCIVSVF
jgi:4'-phosphopantetheinyl transferase EntD